MNRMESNTCASDMNSENTLIFYLVSTDSYTRVSSATKNAWREPPEILWVDTFGDRQASALTAPSILEQPPLSASIVAEQKLFQ